MKRTAVMRGGLWTFLLAIAGAALGHATIVIGTLATEPTSPMPGQPFTLTLDMTDASQVPVEDAVVLAEFRRASAGELVSVTLNETDVPGTYEGEVLLSEAGLYALLLRDQTFRQEEARVSLEVTLGQGPLFQEDTSTIVFPPTATTSPQSLRTWLIWVIALPIAAGIVVTVLVLFSSRSEADEDDP